MQSYGDDYGRMGLVLAAQTKGLYYIRKLHVHKTLNIESI